MKFIAAWEPQIPECVRQIEDKFSQDLVYLWDARYMKGRVYYMQSVTGECIGYVLLQESKKDWTIRGLFVQEQYRGQHYGDALLIAIDELIQKGEKKVCYVNITKGAENIYIKHGFEILGPRPDFPDQIKAKKTYD